MKYNFIDVEQKIDCETFDLELFETCKKFELVIRRVFNWLKYKLAKNCKLDVCDRIEKASDASVELVEELETVDSKTIAINNNFDKIIDVNEDILEDISDAIIDKSRIYL